MSSSSFPELEEIIDHLTYINKENYHYLACSDLLQQKMLYGRVIDDTKIKRNLSCLVSEVLFWSSVNN